MTTKDRISRATVALAWVGAVAVAGCAVADTPAAGDEMLGLYDRMQVALAGDSSAGVEEAAKSLAAQAEVVAGRASDPAPYRAVADNAKAVAAESGIEEQREAFRLLSLEMAKLVESGQLAEAVIFFCPMADAYWLQKAGDDALRNPYYGKSMLTCGSKVDKVED